VVARWVVRWDESGWMDPQWYHFDDDSCEPIDAERVVSPCALPMSLMMMTTIMTRAVSQVVLPYFSWESSKPKHMGLAPQVSNHAYMLFYRRRPVDASSSLVSPSTPPCYPTSNGHHREDGARSPSPSRSE
jgi:hypothetical protein